MYSVRVHIHSHKRKSKLVRYADLRFLCWTVVQLSRFAQIPTQGFHISDNHVSAHMELQGLRVLTGMVLHRTEPSACVAPVLELQPYLEAQRSCNQARTVVVKHLEAPAVEFAKSHLDYTVMA